MMPAGSVCQSRAPNIQLITEELEVPSKSHLQAPSRADGNPACRVAFLVPRIDGQESVLMG